MVELSSLLGFEIQAVGVLPGSVRTPHYRGVVTARLYAASGMLSSGPAGEMLDHPPGNRPWRQVKGLKEGTSLDVPGT